MDNRLARQFQNPILSGFHPDPSICRVGDDYYLVTSSFEYFPGLPIFHSRDLVHWRQIGHVLDRPSQLPLQDARPSGGIYAPTIRHHDGVFCVVTTNVSAGGNFVVTATDPAGPWSDPIGIDGAQGIDPSLFFGDDGRCYYVGNGDPETSLYDGHHVIWLQEIDRQTWQLVGEKRVIVNGGSDIKKQPIWIEGPHLYKIEGRYYLLAAEGGTEENHSEVVFRSDDLWGPYESFPGNPILTNRDLDPSRFFPITCTGHADLVETQAGEWWMVLLACRPYAPFGENDFNTGRETFLVPIEWRDGWPMVADGSRHVGYTYPAPNLPEHRWEDGYGLANLAFRDEFEEPQLARIWNTIREPGNSWYSLSARAGFIRIDLRPEELAGAGNPSFLGVRQRHAAFAAEIAMDFEPVHQYESAGLAVQQNNTAYYSLEKTIDGGQPVVRLIMREGASIAPVVVAQAPAPTGRLRLKAEADGKDYGFFFAGDGGDWEEIGGVVDGRILSTRHTGGFVGAYLGPYATSRGKPTASHADFDYFDYQGNDEVFKGKS